MNGLSEHAFRLLPYRGMGSGNQFTASVQRPQAQGAGEQVTGQVEALLVTMGETSWSRKAMMEKLSLKGRDNFEKLYLAPALAAGLTAQGKALLK